MKRACCSAVYDSALTRSALARLSDLVGADIGLHVGKNFMETFPERVYLLSSLCA